MDEEHIHHNDAAVEAGDSTHDHEWYHAHGLSHDHLHDHAHMHAHTHGGAHPHVHENQKAVLNRLARAIGHLEHVKKMVETGVDCSEVLIQLSAVRSALNNTGKLILEDHIKHCIVDAVECNDMQAIEDLCVAVDRFIK